MAHMLDAWRGHAPRMRKRVGFTRMATAVIQGTATGISDRPLSDPQRIYVTDRYLASQ